MVIDEKLEKIIGLMSHDDLANITLGWQMLYSQYDKLELIDIICKLREARALPHDDFRQILLFTNFGTLPTNLFMLHTQRVVTDYDHEKGSQTFDDCTTDVDFLVNLRNARSLNIATEKDFDFNKCDKVEAVSILNKNDSIYTLDKQKIIHLYIEDFNSINERLFEFENLESLKVSWGDLNKDHLELISLLPIRLLEICNCTIEKGANIYCADNHRFRWINLDTVRAELDLSAFIGETTKYLNVHSEYHTHQTVLHNKEAFISNGCELNNDPNRIFPYSNPYIK